MDERINGVNGFNNERFSSSNFTQLYSYGMEQSGGGGEGDGRRWEYLTDRKALWNGNERRVCNEWGKGLEDRKQWSL